MISINCDVDEIQMAIDQYREVERVVESAVEATTESAYEVMSGLGIRWFGVYPYLRFMALLNGNRSIDEFIEEFTGVKMQFAFYPEGDRICSELESYITTTSENTTHFLLSGEHLDFVCFYCTVKEEQKELHHAQV